jgi:hypothetical protein
MRSPEGSRLRGFYFRPHPLMPGERGGENTSVEAVTHYCDRGIVFGLQNARRERNLSKTTPALLGFIGPTGA